MGYSLNPDDPDFIAMVEKVEALEDEEARRTTFVDSELLALPLEARQEIFADPRVEPFSYAMRQYLNPDYEMMSEEAGELLATLEPTAGWGEYLYDILYNVEMPNTTITMPDGTEAELTEELIAEVAYSDEYDSAFRAQRNQAWLERTEPYIDSFAALLEMTISENWAYAQIGGYESSREAALTEAELDPAAFDLLIEAVHQGTADFQRFLTAHGRGLGLEEQCPIDLNLYLSDYSEEIPYELAVERTREVLSVLGEEGLADYDELISGGYVDVYPTDTKQADEMAIAPGAGSRPYVLLNYEDTPADGIMFATMMSYAIYNCFNVDHQEIVYAEQRYMTCQVAYWIGSLLYTDYMIENADTEEERLFYLEAALKDFADKFFTAALHAEFEDALYQTVEAGGSLDAEAISDQWTELYRAYRDDAIVMLPNLRYGWADVQALYGNYARYQDAAALAYAAAICQRITSGEEGAVENYLSFMKLGSSQSPMDLFAVAGADPLDAETYQLALDFIGGLVDEYEAMVDVRLEAE